MIQRHRIAALCFASTLAWACGAGEEVSPVTVAEDVEAIKAAFAELVRVSEEGDAEAYGEFITEDALYLGPSAPPRVGKSAIVPWVGEFFDGWEFDFPEWTTEEVIVSGDIAMHRYSGVATLTPKDGGDPIVEDRKYIDILRRESDGRWRVSHHMYNLNQ